MAKRQMTPKPRFYYGWVIVGVVAIGGLAASSQMLPVISVFLKPMTEEFGWSRTAFTSAITAGTLTGAGLAPISGALVDRVGARWLAAGAFAGLGAALLLMSAVSAYWQFFMVILLARTLHMGVISAVLQGPIVPQWFVLRRGRAVAISSLGLRSGLSIHPSLTQFLVNATQWRTALIALAVMIWALGVLPLILFLRRKPEDMGLLPDGETPEGRDERLRQTTATDEVTMGAMDVSMTLKAVLREPSFYLLTGAFSLAFFVVSGTTFHGIPYFIDRGLSSEMAALALSLWAAAAIPGMMVAGFLSERINPRRMMMFTLPIMGLTFWLMLEANAAPLALIWGIAFGLSEGGIFTTQQVIFANYYGRASIGAIRGVLWMVLIVANALGALVGSVFYDLRGDYLYTFILFGASSGLAAVCAALARPPKLRPPTQPHPQPPGV